MKGSSILIVEDEMIIAMEIRATLKKMGYNIAGSAINGYDAVQTAGETKPDLVLMDIRLKGDMDGIEAAKKIMHLYDIPVIFLTGNSDKITVERAVAIKPAGFLVKPFKERELFGNIEMAIHKHKVTSKIRSAGGFNNSTNSVAKKISVIKSAMISTDTRGIINNTNSAAADLIGINRDKIIGRKISEIFTSSSKSGIKNQEEPELSLVWPDSITFEKDWESIPVTLLSGFVIDDIKEVKNFIFSINSEIKETIDVSENLFKTLIESLNEIIFLADKEMNITQYNKNFLDFSKRLGISSFQLTRPFYEIEELSSFIEAEEYVGVFRTGSPVSRTKRLKTKNNEMNYFRINLIPEFNNENVVSITTIIDDITPLIHAEEHSKYITESLKDIENSLTEVNSMIYRLKEPLFDIMKKSETKKDPSFELINERAGEIADIVENFEIQKIKYEDAIDHIKFLDKTSKNW